MPARAGVNSNIPAPLLRFSSESDLVTRGLDGEAGSCTGCTAHVAEFLSQVQLFFSTSYSVTNQNSGRLNFTLTVYHR